MRPLAVFVIAVIIAVCGVALHEGYQHRSAAETLARNVETLAKGSFSTGICDYSDRNGVTYSAPCDPQGGKPSRIDSEKRARPIKRGNFAPL